MRRSSPDIETMKRGAGASICADIESKIALMEYALKTYPYSPTADAYNREWLRLKKVALAAVQAAL